MKRKKVLMLCLSLVLCAYVLSRCADRYYSSKDNYAFLHPMNEITSVSIVTVFDPLSPESEIEEKYQLSFEEIVSLNDDQAASLLEALTQIKCHYIRFGDPLYLRAGSTTIKIDYSCGDYEFIAYSAQATCKNGRFRRTSYHFFDETEFKKLIEQTIDSCTPQNQIRP